MPPSSDPRFPDEALEALSFAELLADFAEFTTTPAGRREVLASRPGMDPVARAARRERGREALAARAAREAPVLSRRVDLRALATQARRRALGAEELLELVGALDQIAELRRWARAREHYPALARLLLEVPDGGELRSRLGASLDPRGEVRDEADPELPALRERIRSLEGKRAVELRRVTEAWKARGVLQNPRPVQRGGRPALAVRATRLGAVRGLFRDRSRSGDTVYVEPEGVALLSNRLAEARAAEAQLIQRILAVLSREVARRAPSLEAADQALGLVDLALACARWCEERGGCFPGMEGRALILRSARHPLLLRRMGAEAVVPVDLALGETFDLLVVTGPNTGGKTVVLKTAGLLAAQACAGLPISAAPGSEVPALPGIDADIGDAQSLAASLSTFSGHLRHLARILAGARRGSLVLLDELGTGTDPEEGAALGRAVLEELLRRGSLVLADTHLGGLKLFSLSTARAENASMEFDPVTLSPSFRLLVGVPGASHALEVAARQGLPESLLGRAAELARRAPGAEELLAEVGEVRSEAERLRLQARAERVAAEDLRLSAERLEEEVSLRARLREGEAEMAFRDLRAALADHYARHGRALLGRLPPALREELEELLRGAQRILEANALARRWHDFLHSLRKGDEVWVPRYRQRMRVLRSDPRRGRLKLRNEELEIELPFQEISWVKPPPGPELAP